MNTSIWRCGNRFAPVTAKTAPPKPAVFFDRDGTLIEEKHYLRHISDLEIFPETIPSLKRLQQADLPLYIFTNQAGIAHGYFTEDDLQLLHGELINQLDQGRVLLSGILYCPHHPEAELKAYRLNCFGRKPNPGLLYQAACREHLDLKHSYVVGDKLSDIKAGKKAGAATILVLTGYGKNEQLKITVENTPDFIATNLGEVAEWILQDLAKPVSSSDPIDLAPLQNTPSLYLKPFKELKP